MFDAVRMCLCSFKRDQPIKESLHGDIRDLDVEKAIETARDIEKWKKIKPLLPSIWGHIAKQRKRKNMKGS